MKRFAMSAALVAATVSAISMTAGPAGAETTRVTDAASDMNHYADVTSAVVRHTRQSVATRIQHDSLRRDGDAGISVYFDVDHGRSGPELVLDGGLYEGTDYGLWRARGLHATGPVLTCSYRMVVDYASGITTVRVSRGCLDDPTEVRAAIRVSGGSSSDLAEDWVGDRRWTDWLARS